MFASCVRALVDPDGKSTAGATAWWIGPEESDLFAPGRASFMPTYRVEDRHAWVEALKAEGSDVLDGLDDSEHG